MSAAVDESGLDPVTELLTSLRIERGHPEPEELAALTVVLTRLRSTMGQATAPAPASRWSDPRHLLGLPPVPGDGGWRASCLPARRF